MITYDKTKGETRSTGPNSRWKNRKERQNRSTNNGYMAEKAKLPASE